MKFKRQVCARFVALAIGLTAGMSQATTYYWDTDGATGGFGNTAGTWGTSAFWSTDSAGASATANTTITTDDVIHFGTASLALGAAATNVSVDAAGVTVNSITFGSAQTPAIVLGTAGNTITLGGTTPTITVDNAGDTISSILAGTSLTKAGSGTLTLTSTNTYSGATVISGGTLKLQGSPVGLGSLYYTFATGAAVNSGTQSVTTTTSGSPTFSATGGPRAGLGYVTLNGSQYIQINPVSGNLPNLSGTSGNSYTIAMWIKTTTQGAEFLYKGNATWGLGCEAFYLTDVTGNAPSGVHKGTHIGGVQYGGGFIGGNSSVADGNWNFISIVRMNGTSTFYVNGVANGTATSMNIAENATQMIRIGFSNNTGDGAAQFNGSISDISVFGRALSATEIQALMQVGQQDGQPLASTAVSIASGATFDLGGASQTVASLADSAGNGGIVTNSAAYMAILTINPSSGSTTFSGAIRGSTRLVKSGSGTQVLSGASAYAGGTAVNNGMLLVNGSITGAVSVASGAYLGGTGAITGSVSFASGAMALFTNDVPLRFTGPVSLNGNTVHLTLSDNLPEGTYLLATNTASGFTGAFAADPVLDSGSTLGTFRSISTDAGGVRLNVFSADTTAPTPNPMSFAVNPSALDANRMVMTATTATDLNPPLAYFFTNTVNGNTSGWISSTVWTNTGLTGGTAYGYQVKARDAALNETDFSSVVNAAPAPRTLNWDGGTTDIGTAGNGASAGGSGTWNTSTLNWDEGASPHVAWIATRDTAVFGGTPGTVTLGSDIPAAGLTFNVSGYTIGGAYTLTLGANNSISANVASPGRTIGFADGVLVTNVNQVQIGYGANLANNALTLTNGARMVVTNSTVIGQATGTGSRDNTLTIMGGAVDSVYNAGNQTVSVGINYGDGTVRNQIVIGAGGSLTNVSGLLIGNSANRNAIRVTGGKLFTSGSIRVGAGGGNPLIPSRTNELLVADGGVVNVAGGLYVGVTGYNFRNESDNTAAGNRLTVTNGGFLSTKADCYIGSDADNLYSGNPSWKGTLLGNMATVGGSLNGANATWDLGGQKLYVGYAGYVVDPTISMSNSLTSSQGGMVTNISTLTVKVDNTLALAPGGQIYATAATINGTLNVSTDDAVTPGCGKLTTSGNLNVANATLNLILPPKPLPGAAYVFGAYGSLTGSFKGTNGLPDGCRIDMNYNTSNQIALIIPPPKGSLILVW